jgi:restriction system protein
MSYERLAQQFKLSPEERAQLLPSGKQATFSNRVGWTRTHLKKAGLLESPGRGKVRISERGLEVLGQKPKTIDQTFLSQFPEYRKFRFGDDSQIATTSKGAIPKEPTPLEALDASVRQLEQELSQELLERVMTCSPRFFEYLVVDLLVAMGYGGSRREAGHVVGKTGDGGIDGVINEDRLGLDIIYVQAKRWKDPVDVQTVRAFAGSLMGQGATKGVLITPSSFTSAAVAYAKGLRQAKIILIDGSQLAQLMIEHNVGVAEAERYVVKKIDLDYFDTP